MGLPLREVDKIAIVLPDGTGIKFVDETEQFPVKIYDSQGNQINQFGVDDKYPAGTGSNGSVTLTDADTSYAVPTTASTKKHVLVLYNGSDTDIYWGFQNTNANGVLLPPDGRVSLNLGASQQVYCYCGTAGKVLTYILKEIE